MRIERRRWWPQVGGRSAVYAVIGALALPLAWLPAPAQATNVQVDWSVTVTPVPGTFPPFNGGNEVFVGSFGVLDASLTTPQDLGLGLTARQATLGDQLFVQTSTGTSFVFTNTTPGALAGELVGDELLFGFFLSSLALGPPDTARLLISGPSGRCAVRNGGCEGTVVFSFETVPEPGTAGLLGAALIGFAARHRAALRGVERNRVRSRHRARGHRRADARTGEARGFIRGGGVDTSNARIGPGKPARSGDPFVTPS